MGCNEPPIILLNVDLPEPLIPTRPMTSPSYAVNVISCSAKKRFDLKFGIKTSCNLSLLVLKILYSFVKFLITTDSFICNHSLKLVT